MHERAGFDVSFRITWYPGRYDAAFRSIFAVGDVTQYVPDSEVCTSCEAMVKNNLSCSCRRQVKSVIGSLAASRSKLGVCNFLCRHGRMHYAPYSDVCTVLVVQQASSLIPESLMQLR